VLGKCLQLLISHVGLDAPEVTHRTGRRLSARRVGHVDLLIVPGVATVPEGRLVSVVGPDASARLDEVRRRVAQDIAGLTGVSVARRRADLTILSD
jgi:hypothetical protein